MEEEKTDFSNTIQGLKQADPDEKRKSVPVKM